jgi:hypothetical protein
MVAVGLLIIAAAGLSSTPAFATTEIGQTQENYQCGANYDRIQTRAAAVSYVAPAPGHLTKWLINGGTVVGKVRFEVWRPNGGGNYKLLYMSPAKTLTTGVVNTVLLSPSVPVDTGDVIGLRTVNQADCSYQTNSDTETMTYRQTRVLPVVGSTYTFSASQNRFLLNIAADFS